MDTLHFLHHIAIIHYGYTAEHEMQVHRALLACVYKLHGYISLSDRLICTFQTTKRDIVWNVRRGSLRKIIRSFAVNDFLISKSIAPSPQGFFTFLPEEKQENSSLTFVSTRIQWKAFWGDPSDLYVWRGISCEYWVVGGHIIYWSLRTIIAFTWFMPLPALVIYSCTIKQVLEELPLCPLLDVYNFLCV